MNLEKQSGTKLHAYEDNNRKRYNMDREYAIETRNGAGQGRGWI